MIKLDKIYNIDCLKGLKKLKDKSIDLIITSPPFNLGNTHHTGFKKHKSYDDKMPEYDYQKWQAKVLDECFRVLKNNGALIFTVPLFDIPKTKKIAKIVNGEIVFEGEPEFHHSRIEGPYTIPTFWHYSLQDICDILSEIGFNAELIDVMITPSQSAPRKVIYAIKKI